MNRHLKGLLLDNILKPRLVQILVRRHVHFDDERALVDGLQTEYLLFRESHLHSEVVEVEFVEHLFRPDGHALERVVLLRLQAVDPELGRDEDQSLDLRGVDGVGVIGDHDRVASDECPDSMDSRHLLHPGLEGHRTAEALDRLEAFHPDRLQFHSRFYPPLLVDCRHLELSSDDERYGDSHDSQYRRDVLS